MINRRELIKSVTAFVALFACGHANAQIKTKPGRTQPKNNAELKVIESDLREFIFGQDAVEIKDIHGFCVGMAYPSPWFEVVYVNQCGIPKVGQVINIKAAGHCFNGAINSACGEWSSVTGEWQVRVKCIAV